MLFFVTRPSLEKQNELKKPILNLSFSLAKLREDFITKAKV